MRGIAVIRRNIRPEFCNVPHAHDQIEPLLDQRYIAIRQCHFDHHIRVARLEPDQGGRQNGNRHVRGQGQPHDTRQRLAQMSRRRLEGAGVVLTATNTMIAELAQDWSTPEGQQLIQLLFTDVLPPISACHPPQP